ncbi:hypothetical protein A2130_01855 [Candidatus Woesebacteria bacterium GWC2_33_12]|uniref:Uncharacterized protein n=1 Tax=Candidatus Woesebacteria bacterium GW2011_GWB1_33_22 TaxID=1618566 RepID=A0A0G0A1E6_9BACT|nr:MAG: hypothetical protein UR29_C0003G0004 [Candidatus Woesebacteria bacterium GW2011_GWC2_33_12]KKP42245.1 MAG: hypothetical protein UR33_C0004G0004 [Candidatus Woesebacteria bacterium GW2011_GWA2_33_20]KKP44976.1 MAG: hypothetical protein UR35_C0004G0008 [Candidatus Woesebacteria bacterium GW2011_GWB1_33_22]KKP46825.1 MAG: hypothetical protein UR37_C0004G0004 [Microgenomates group bacterium GW2011_GWC1_33_28]KKP50697.1 MAG: hypothetical protein UR41_C0004G0008 [Candidatus Woesebacteria bact
MKYLIIKSLRPEKIDVGLKNLGTYLLRNCDNCFIKKQKIHFPLEEVIRILNTNSKIALKSFLIHTPDYDVDIKTRNINLDKLSTLQYAEIIFGGEAV